MSYPRAAALVAAAFLIARPAPTFAQVEEIRIAVAGMTCNLCAAGLERSLRKVDGVSRVQVSLADEAAVVTLKPGAAFDAARLRTAVRDAGQQARHFDLRITGTVEGNGAGYRVHPGRGAPIAVARGSADAVAPHAGKTIRARARMAAAADSPLELELTDIR
jgi:copper chaperone CopZ